MWRESRDDIGVKMRGGVAEVWQGAQQVGVLFRWTLGGFDGKWDGAAAKYCFDPAFDQHEVEFRFRLENVPMQLRGYGYVRGATCDGETYRDSVELKGTRLWVETGIPVLGESS